MKNEKQPTILLETSESRNIQEFYSSKIVFRKNSCKPFKHW